MPWLSDFARRKKIDYFVRPLPRHARILEVGCAGGWLGSWLRQHGWMSYVGLDLMAPADVVGDIRDWRRLGLREQSFDAVIAFEVVEHVDCLQECFDLLRPGGLLLLTSPVPHMDWLCWLLERLGLNQRRTSPHDHLIDFRTIARFQAVALRRVAGMAQWGILRKPVPPAPVSKARPVAGPFTGSLSPSLDAAPAAALAAGA